MIQSALHAPPHVPAAILPEGLLSRFDRAGPRYTSYPTADRFDERLSVARVADEWHRRQAFAGRAGGALSLYVHVPFCESVCYYCACNKIVTRRHERVAPYLDALAREARLAGEVVGPRVVDELHLGGGTPTFLDDDELAALVDGLRGRFTFAPDAELSVEVDPRTVTPARLAWLRDLGFRRLSFGVQDFEPAVQEAVHRVQPRELVAALMRSARALGFASINADLIYGLPRQSPETFRRTVAAMRALRPDRIALYPYAHLPERFKPQRRIVAAELPSSSDRIAMLAAAVNGFLDAGYVYVGMDHFALPGDDLAVAKRDGRLQRNFQGYSTQPDGDMLGLGVSAISRVGSLYYQNEKTLPEYQARLAAELPVARGIELSDDDVLRRDVIMTLLCQGRFDPDDLEARYGIAADRYFADEIAELAALADDDLLSRHARRFDLTSRGWFVARAVAMLFDHHLRTRLTSARFSRVL